MRRLLCICAILTFGAIFSGTSWSVDFVSSTPPGGPLLRSLYSSVTGLCQSSAASYRGKTKAVINQVTVYQAYVLCEGYQADVINLYRTDLLYWYYSITSPNVPNGTATGIVQTSYSE